MAADIDTSIAPANADRAQRVATTTAPRSVREVTMELLRRLGVTTIFGNPGSTELPMFRDFPDDFRYVLGLQESTVMGMADGFAQATRNASIINVHSAAGLGHALGNLFTARKNQTPLIIIAGQQARSLLPFDPYLFAERATEFPQPHVKWSNEPARAQDVPAAIMRAYYIAMQPPRGPVFLSVPLDDWDEPAEELAQREVSRSMRPDARLIGELASALERASNPVIVGGQGIALDDAWDEMVALAERHNARVWVAPNASRNVFPEDHRLFAGFLPADRGFIVRQLTGHDLVLVVGAPAFTYHVEGRGPHVPPGAKLYQLVDDPAVAAWAPEGTAIVTSIKPALAELLGGRQPMQRREPESRPAPAELAAGILTEPYLMSRIQALRDPQTIIVEEAPSSRGSLQAHLRILRPDGFYTGASGGLGFALPAAVGVALAKPGDKIIAVIGDGSALYSIQALWSAAQLGLPISFVIVNNRGYFALKAFGQRFGLTETIGSDILGFDFCKVAEGQGLTARRVEAPGDLDEALRWSYAASGPTLVEVMVQPDPNAEKPWWSEA